MAVAFGGVYIRLKLGDAAELDMAKADTGNPYTDALTHRRNGLIAAGMDNPHGGSLLLDGLFAGYKGSDELLDIFKEGVTATAAAPKNSGSETSVEFQLLTKACPAFAVRYAAVVHRHDRRYSGPINRKGVELRWECHDLFRSVQGLIDREGFTAV